MTFSLQAKHGSYFAVLRVPDENGVHRQKWINTGVSDKRGNKKEAMRIAQKIANEYDCNKISPRAKIPFCDWIESWLKKKELEVEPNTYQGYLSYYQKHIGPYFKKRRTVLNDITADDIQGYFNAKARLRGDESDERLSGQSLRKHNVVIRGALDDAVRSNIIPVNYADRVTIPKPQEFHGNFYTKKQVSDLFAAVKGTPIEGIVMLTVYYGLRRSEAIGLKWSAVDFDRGTVTIQSTVVQFDTVLEKESTKNRSSKRTYPMSQEIKEILLAIKGKQDKMKSIIGPGYNDHGYVFTWDDGTFLRPDYVTAKFRRILKQHGLPHIRFHDLRHTTASIMIENGADLKRVSEWLGHSNVGTTANIYAHLSFEAKKESLQIINSAINVDNGDGKTM